MSLYERAKAAREHADGCTDPGCHALANALDAALRAESDQLLGLALPVDPVDTSTLPTPEEAGFPCQIQIPKPDAPQ